MSRCLRQVDSCEAEDRDQSGEEFELLHFEKSRDEFANLGEFVWVVSGKARIDSDDEKRGLGCLLILSLCIPPSMSSRILTTFIKVTFG